MRVLRTSDMSNVRTGLIASSGGASSREIVRAADVLRDRGVRKIGPYTVTKTMSSSISACLATPFKIKGLNYSLTSACATSAHCIGVGAEQIQFGKQDIVFAGGGEELDWTLACLFDAMGALSSKYNDAPATASRPYDATRDGFVIAGGGGMVVLEELEHAKARGAKIYAELVGFRFDVGWLRYGCAVGRGRAALHANGESSRSTAPIDYINTHGTSTPVGDVKELERHARRVRRRCAALRLVEIDVRPFAGCNRRAGGNSLPPDARTRLHCAIDQCQRPGSCSRRHAPGDRAASRTRVSGPPCPTVSVLAAPTARSYFRNTERRA